MSKKHNTKHPSRGLNVRYQEKKAQGKVPFDYEDYTLSDNRRVSAKR